MDHSPSIRADWPLTARQYECLQGFWSRKSAKEIAVELGISHHAVEKHLLACRQSLQVNSSIEAARQVFGPPQGATVRPYYDLSDVGANSAMQQSPAIPPHNAAGLASNRSRVNPLGIWATFLTIIAVAVGAILAVTALIAAAEGANQLWRGLLN